MTVEVRPLRDRRFRVYAGGRFVAAYAIGHYRPYVYPLCTPSGIPVTEESPVDHPHHQSLWIGQDEVDGVNFWLNEPGYGRIVGDEPEVTVESTAGGSRAVFRHDLSWSAPNGTVHLVEHRTTSITPTAAGIVVDVRSRRRPATRVVELGATKEAGFGIRVGDALDEDDGGLLRSSCGRRGEVDIFDSDADFVDYSGHLGGSPVGVVVMPGPHNPRHPWFVRAYGLVLLNHHRFEAQRLGLDDEVELCWRVVAYDGSATLDGLAELQREYCDASLAGVIA